MSSSDVLSLSRSLRRHTRFLQGTVARQCLVVVLITMSFIFLSNRRFTHALVVVHRQTRSGLTKSRSLLPRRWNSPTTSSTSTTYLQPILETSQFQHRRFSSLSMAVSAIDEDSLYEYTQDDDVQAPFCVTAPYQPTGDQPYAIDKLTQQLKQGNRFSILHGSTGTGKTFVLSHVIAKHGRPVLVLCHNKTLAAQLARELQSFLSQNAVELFVSYYNHYVPESYIEASGRYIAKKSSINSSIDALRHCATRALLTRKDVVVVASVSCIYGLGLPKEYLQASVTVNKGDVVDWDDWLYEMENMLYTYSDNHDTFERGQYQLSGPTKTIDGKEFRSVTLWPPQESFPMQIEVKREDQQGPFVISDIREGRQNGLFPLESYRIFPAKHHVVSDERREDACLAIEEELLERLQELRSHGKHDEAERLHKRVTNDLSLIRRTGFCPGGENYSRHFAGRAAGEAPDTLMDYLSMHGDDWLLVVDESHVTLPQLKAMYEGDQARKRMLVKHGYRLPSALDNRPLQESEFWHRVNQTVFVSATPSKQELNLAEAPPVEMTIRPTFVCDPEIEVRRKEGQLDDLLAEVVARARKNERTLAIALTKRDAEDLSSYFQQHGISSDYIHSGLKTTERSVVLKALQKGEIDVLVGVNLLREGLDLPQVSLVAIMNADSDGFLRSETALLQTVGRAARNVNGKAIFYANRMSDSMKKCIDATARRRQIQLDYNKKHGCEMVSTKGSTTRSIFDILKDKIEAEQQFEIARRQQDPALTEEVDGSVALRPKKASSNDIETDHIPSTPGVYMWKDGDDNILYIGKATRLRSRVKSYLSPNAKHSRRIKAMVENALSVEFVLTPSARDALVLESNLIKHHQPPFNVLMKDDEHYPYISATIGDSYPRFVIVPRPEEPRSSANQRYRYFGPYTSFKEINAMIDSIEEKYELRAKSFLARHGSLTKAEYQELFREALENVFDVESDESLQEMRKEFEEAGLLFDSRYNLCRDVAVVAEVDGEPDQAIVLVLQLRDGLLAGKFSYLCSVPFGLSAEEDKSVVLQTVLETRHYPSGQESSDPKFTWFPDDVLLSHPPLEERPLRDAIVRSRADVDPRRKKTTKISTMSPRDPKRTVDARALDFAFANVAEEASTRKMKSQHGPFTSINGDASTELAELLSLDDIPERIECYDISHTQGEFPVGSRVVFVGGKPVPELYRQFNIKTVDGIDDYKSLEEVLERRFRRAWVNGEGGPVEKGDPWALPDLVVIDGGPGQLSSAIKGMTKAGIFPDEKSSAGYEGHRFATVPVCALAKSEEQVFVHDQKEPVNESPDSPGLLLLRSLRDASHKFALKNHRRRRSVVKSSRSN